MTEENQERLNKIVEIFVLAGFCSQRLLNLVSKTFNNSKINVADSGMKHFVNGKSFFDSTKSFENLLSFKEMFDSQKQAIKFFEATRDKNIGIIINLILFVLFSQLAKFFAKKIRT